MTETVPLDSVHPDPANVRLHPSRNLDQIKSSLARFGQQKPLVVDRAGIIRAGNGTWEAARALGWTSIEIRRTDLAGAEATAYAIADNRSTETSLFDPLALDSTLKALAAEGAGLDESWWTTDEIDALLASVGQLPPTYGDPDAVPDARAEPVSERGDLWLCGRHRLLVGDSTDAVNLVRLLDRHRADCVFTSPPYAVGVDYGDYRDDIESLRALLPKISRRWLDVVIPGGYAVVNFGDITSARDVAGSDTPCEYPMALEYWPIFRADGWVLWSRRVWCKPNPRVQSPWCIQSNRAATDWEHIWTWKAPGDAIIRRVDGDYASANGWFDTVRADGVDVGKDVHGAGMAVYVARRMVAVHSRSGAVVFEPFMGTGTTMIACEQLERACYGCELEPRFADVTLDRYSAFADVDPIHADTGQRWSELKAERVALAV